MNKNKVNKLFIFLLIISFFEVLIIEFFNIKFPQTWYSILTSSATFMMVISHLFMGYFKIKGIIENHKLKNILELIVYILSLVTFILIIIFVEDTLQILKICILQAFIYLLFTYISDCIDIVVYAIWTKKQIFIAILSVILMTVITYLIFSYDYLNVLIMVVLTTIYISKYFVQGVNKEKVKYIDDFSFVYMEYINKDILNVEIREFSKNNVRLGFVDQYKREIFSQWYRKKDLEKVVRLTDNEK